MNKKVNMKNENGSTSDVKNSKIVSLKKKLSGQSEDSEKKLKKGTKTSSFVRKFSKYLSSSSDSIRRASSSKSCTTESDTSAEQSSGGGCPTSVQQKETSTVGVPARALPLVDDITNTTGHNNNNNTNNNNNKNNKEGITGRSEKPPRQPVSVTPYAISAWRSNGSSSASTISDNYQINVPNHSMISDADFMDTHATPLANTDELEDTQKQQDSSATSPQQHFTESEQVDCDADTMPAFGNLVMDVTKDRPDITAITSNISQSGLERKEHLYKILVIGELGTGKTSIIKRYVHQFFSQHYRATIGVDFALKVLNWDANTIIRLQLWDIAGQERFGNMTRVYYKDAVGAFIVFDVTRVATFDAVDKWKQDLDSKVQLPDGSNIPCVLLGNKCDQQKEGIVNTPSRMDEYCKEKGFSGWFETSAKENVNIEEAARFLVNKILLNDKLLHHSSDLNKDNDRIAIDDKGDTNGHSKSISKTCSC